MRFFVFRGLLVSAFLFFAAVPPAGAESAESKSPRALALAVGCAGCHGASGRGSGSIPAIAGKAEPDFIRRMREFQGGKAGATVMNRIARGYSDDELAILAKHFTRP